jgi:hypothetical protein
MLCHKIGCIPFRIKDFRFLPEFRVAVEGPDVAVDVHASRNVHAVNGSSLTRLARHDPVSKKKKENKLL